MKLYIVDYYLDTGNDYCPPDKIAGIFTNKKDALELIDKIRRIPINNEYPYKAFLREEESDIISSEFIEETLKEEGLI